MAAYCIFNIREVTDPAAMDDYRGRVLATVERFGGRYVVRGGKFDVVEGDWQPTLLVIVEFPSLEQARRWYDSEEYRDLKETRLRATRCDGVFVEGLADGSR